MRMARPPLTAPTRVTVWTLAWLLVCMFVLTQTLGLMHGVIHGPQAHARGTHHAGGADHGRSWLEPLFSSHEEDKDCRLYDQASHGSGAPVMPVLCLPMVLASLVFDISRGEALARWAALFDARGPPLTR